MAEKEYIERDSLIGKLIEMKYCSTSSKIDFGDVIRLINSEPTADVQEVRHGKWEDNAEDVYWGNHFTRKHCSECGNKPEYREGKNSYVLSNYCRNCGAKMDKE